MARAPNNHVAKIVSDPASPPDTVIVAGYLGKSPHEGYERLYLTPNLSHWIDIPKDDVLHQAPVPGDPLNAAYVWVQAGSHILHKGQHPPEEPSEDAPSAHADAGQSE